VNVKRKWEISFRQFAQTFEQKRCEMQHFAQKRQGDGRRRADERKEVIQ